MFGMVDANWNIFRYLGDYLHFGGMLLGLVVVLATRSVHGFSAKTQVLYQLVYFCRYLDVFEPSQSRYLVFFKLTFNFVTFTMIFLFYVFRASYDVVTDSCNVLAIVMPAALVAHITSGGSGLKEEMWTFSEFLEPFALLPQYIVCYRARRVRGAALLYVVALGGYRVLYVCNWIYKRYVWHGRYHDYVSWFAGGMECLMFVNFVVGMAKGRREAVEASILGNAILSIDDSAGRLSETLELRTFGRRLPLGVSGAGAKDGPLGAGCWEVSDAIESEENCGLLTLDGDVEGYF
eukprot:TRINITY_DN75284_c0_g1_i1.p1 TRINITY_DN75284_c0_g1~~TRINITY_DN75284_c0_g1_i1.p1  ORF type:complete len:292 (+),score=60.43 TRINITY_DN75284_c0_g1_i1:179-1054(+)